MDDKKGAFHIFSTFLIAKTTHYTNYSLSDPYHRDNDFFDRSVSKAAQEKLYFVSISYVF